MMKDINFFTPYQEKRKESKHLHTYIYGIAAIVMLAIVVSFAANHFRIYRLEKDIKYYTNEMNDSKFSLQLKQAENVNNQIDILTDYDNRITDISKAVIKRDLVSDTLLNNISSTIPSEISFKNITINSGNISLQGVSTNRTAVAELKYNLSNLEELDSVYVNSINNSGAVDGEYSFDIKCVLKDVD